MKTITLIKENTIYNENKNINFDGTIEEVKKYLKQNGLEFIRQSAFSGAVYYR